jgi:hypothetical protein
MSEEEFGFMLVENKLGGYRFLPGGKTFSAGVIAAAGHEIVHVTLRKTVPFQEGFGSIESHLSKAGRPLQALCAIELRSPTPMSFEGFEAFNRGYEKLIADQKVLIDGQMPIARTNVAPQILPPQEPAIYGFSYTLPSQGGAASFILAGVGDIGPDGIIRPGETSEDALAEKASYVMETLQDRTRQLGVDNDQVTTTNIYTVHNVHSFRTRLIDSPLRKSASLPVCWFLAWPPIAGLEFEMDFRGVGKELFC